MVSETTHVRVRVVALVTRGDEVLVVTQSNGRESWNCFPGGQLEHGETLETCLTRELMEELSLAVEVKDFVACGTFVEGKTTSLEMYLCCEPRGANISINENHIVEARFVPVQDLAAERVYPLELSRDLATLLTQTRSGGTYYGQFD
jgi:NAD+ diphosphatase